MKWKFILLLFFSNSFFCQIELKFENSFVYGEKKISIKQIRANSMVLEQSNDLKFWIKEEPRKLSPDERKFSENPKNFPLITDYDVYITRFSINCEAKYIRLYEMYQYDGFTKKLKFHEDYSSFYNNGLTNLKDSSQKNISETLSEPEFLVYQEKCEKSSKH